MRARWRRASAAGSAPAKVACPVSSSRCTEGPVAAISASISALALDHRAHVMVVDEPHAFGERAVADLGHALPELRPVGGGEHGPLGQRLAAVAMDRIRGFGEHQHVAAERLEQVEMRPQMLHLVGGVAAQQLGRIPAGHEATARTCRARPRAPSARAETCGRAPCPRSRPPSLRRGRFRAASRRRARACRRSTSRSGWRRCVPPCLSLPAAASSARVS